MKTCGQCGSHDIMTLEDVDRCTLCGAEQGPLFRSDNVLCAPGAEDPKDHKPYAKSHGGLYAQMLEELAIPYPSFKLPLWSAFNEILGGFRTREYTILCGQTGVGKCLGAGTPVIRFDGTTARVEDIRVGDLLMGPDSEPREVLSTCSGVDDLFEISPKKGEPWVCNSPHMLTLVHSPSGKIKDIPLEAYLKKNKTYKHTMKLFRVGVEYQSKWTSVLSPYFVGVWLGDGETKSQRIHKPDFEIEEACRVEAEKFGLRLVLSKNNNRTKSYSANGSKGSKNPIREALVEFGLGKEKHIPIASMLVDRESRISLLAGLLDTDGHLSNGCFEFSSSLSSLADGVMLLSRSVGLFAKKRIKRVNGKDYYIVLISGECSMIPTRIKRKQAKKRTQKKNALRTGFSVSPIGRGPYYGFELSGDGRFLLGDFTVTHNTTFLANISHQLLLAKKKHFVASVETGSTDFMKRVVSSMLRKDINTGDALPIEWLEKIDKNHGDLLSGDDLQLSLYNNRIPVEILIKDILWMKENKGCDIAMIDNLNFFMEVEDERKQVVEMDRVTHELIMFCKNIDVHIIMVMHPKKTDGGRVCHEFDIKGSSTAVQEAHNILLLNRPHADTLEEGKANVSDRELKFQKIRRRGKYSGMTLVLKNVNHSGVCYEEGVSFWERQLAPRKSSRK